VTAPLSDQSIRPAPRPWAALRLRAVVPDLARGLLAARGPNGLGAGDLAETYRLTLTVLFRLLFLLYAADKGLLPRSRNGPSVRSLRAQVQGPHAHPSPGVGSALWAELCEVLRTLEEGGPEGAGVTTGLAGLALPDRVVAPLLRELVITIPEGFRGLSVRDFGALYERLLESELSVAAVALTVDERGLYRPCRDGEKPLVEKGQVYVHDRSGARKATGTYFTPELAVAHLLDRALEPALAEHFARLDALRDDAAGERLFDFRVADLAMGSGHFLLGAVDRLERGFRQYLARRPLPGARDGRLLRRLLARHCLYGVDTSPAAVDLARLSLSLCTFAPGLPLLMPEHNLIVGNALVSGGDAPAEGSAANLTPVHFPTAFPEAFRRERAGFDVILGNPPWQEATLEEHAFWARHSPGLRSLSQHQQEARKAGLRRERPDLVRQHQQERAEAAALRAALAAGQYPGMGMGDPDLYKAFAWRCWELLVPSGGWLGVVLPRAAWTALGSAAFRTAALAGADPLDVTVLLNNRQWVFPDVHPQYSVALVAARRGRPQGKSLKLRGPFRSLENYHVGMTRPPGEFAAAEVASWTDTASLPLLPAEESLEVLARLRQAPRLDLEGGPWRARPHTELHATNDKGLLDVASAGRPPGHWPVYKGESFDLWQPDTGRYYAWADPGTVLEALQAKRLRAGRNRRSPFSELDPAVLRDPRTLPCLAPRLAFRDVTNRTNQRTVIAALVPPKVFLANQAPCLLWPRGDQRDEAYLLGVLCSLPLDWYARRFVESHVNFFVFNPLPVPRPPEDDPLRKRAVELAGRLAAPDDRFADWARAVGVACGPLGDAEKQDHIHELDAVVAHLYGLQERHLVHIFGTFHEGWDSTERLKQTLEHFRHWSGKAR
jgi:hypothetical protein